MFEGTRNFVRQLALASVSVTALMPLYSAPAQAQALQPIADVCTGISLNRSAVTEVIGAVNGPLVNTLQSRVNALTNVQILGLPLLNVPDLNIDLTSILANAAAGDPISLQILDTNGDVIGPGNCNVGADAFTLNQEGGISIGGNSITGLGTNGQAATAGEQSAIAFGNNASTSVGATGAVAIGTGASVTAANGVAIGAGALADRGAQTGYTAPFITGTSNSIGSVSVGTAGGLRQITNVAPGTAATDAATVGQVQGVIAAVGNLGGLAVQYTDATQAAVTLGGASGTTISNLAPGTLSAASTQAVNGSQLFATNGLVAGNTGAIAALDAAAVQYDDATHQTVTFDGAGGTRLTNVSVGALGAASTDAVNGSQLFTTNGLVAGNTAAIGANTTAITALDGRVTTNTGAITAIDARVTTNTGSIAALDAAAVQYDDASHQLVTLDGAGGTRISNVLAGAVNATSTDAVNGAQLNATNQQIANLTNSGIQYDDPSHATVTFDGAAGTRLTNVTAGALNATSTDAVNGSQLFATNQAVGAIDARVTANTTAITNIDARLTTTQAAVANAVQYDDATKGTITLGGATGTTISNVAPGALTAASTQAVNGSQLFATNQQVGANTASITNLDGRVTTNTTAINNLDGRVTTNTTAINNLDGRVTTNTTDIANLDGRVTNNTTSISNLDGRVTTNTTNIAALDGRVTNNTTAITNNTTAISNLDGRVTTNTTNIASLDGRVTNNTSSITNLDGRVTTIDGRVTGNTTAIADLDGRVTNNSSSITTLQTQVANVPVRFVSDADRTTPSATPTNTAALVSASGGTTTLTNVAPATLSATSTDAVNGAQLFATNQQVGANTTAITQLSTTLAGAPKSPVQYSNAATPTQANGGTITNDVTLAGANPAAPVALHNVANATLANDATNLGQLQNGLAAAISTSRSYTDQQFAAIGFDLADLGKDVSRLRKGAFSGTAAAMAVAGIPQTMEVGKSMVGGAVGHYRGRTAFALGASTTLGGEGQAVVKAGATMDTNGKGGFSAGAGFSF